MTETKKNLVSTVGIISVRLGYFREQKIVIPCTPGIAVVDVYLFKAAIRVSGIRDPAESGGIDPVLVGDDLPELGPDLVATLANLEVDNRTHS